MKSTLISKFAENPNGDATSGMSIEYNGEGTGSNNKIHINDIAGSPVVTFESGGQVGIGVSSPTFALHLPDNSVSGKARAHSWTTYSDMRIKSDVTNISYGLAEILSLNPFFYKQHASEFKDSKLEIKAESQETIGFLAQDVYEIIPEAVSKPEDKDEQLWGMDYDKLIPVLVKGIQEQQEQIQELRTEITNLKNILMTSHPQVKDASSAILKEQ